MLLQCPNTTMSRKLLPTTSRPGKGPRCYGDLTNSLKGHANENEKGRRPRHHQASKHDHHPTSSPANKATDRPIPFFSDVAKGQGRPVGPSIPSPSLFWTSPCTVGAALIAMACWVRKRRAQTIWRLSSRSNKSSSISPPDRHTHE